MLVSTHFAMLGSAYFAIVINSIGGGGSRVCVILWQPPPHWKSQSKRLTLTSMAIWLREEDE